VFRINTTNVKYYQYSNNFVIPALYYCHSRAGGNPESTGTYNYKSFAFVMLEASIGEAEASGDVVFES
jgi:hypothetical protein